MIKNWYIYLVQEDMFAPGKLPSLQETQQTDCLRLWWPTITFKYWKGNFDFKGNMSIQRDTLESSVQEATNLLDPEVFMQK